MSTATRARNKEIVKYVLTTSGLEDDDVNAIVDDLRIANISLIETLAPAFQVIADSDKVSAGAVGYLIEICTWIRQYRARGDNKLPKDLDDWKVQFTEEFRDQIVSGTETTPPTAVTDTGIVATRDKSSMSVKIADFPAFNGHHDNWYAFRKEFEATVSMFYGNNELITVSDESKHTTRRATDATYDARVKELFAILKKKTSRGGALTKVTKYESTQDGALAWKYLKEYYDQEGNADLYRSKCMNELTNKCKLEYNSHGGMDAYVSEFERICDLLEECGFGLDETIKKTFFLNNIHDRAYENIKDICRSENKSYQESVMLFRTKAIELKKASGPGKNKQRNALNAKAKKDKNDKKKSQGNKDGNKQGNKDYRLPSDVWSKMSREQKTLWLKMKKETKEDKKDDEGKTQYGKQYQGQKAKQMKQSSSDREEELEDGEIQEEDPRSTKVNLWKPVPRKQALMKQSTKQLATGDQVELQVKRIATEKVRYSKVPPEEQIPYPGTRPVKAVVKGHDLEIINKRPLENMNMALDVKLNDAIRTVEYRTVKKIAPELVDKFERWNSRQFKKRKIYMLSTVHASETDSEEERCRSAEDPRYKMYSYKDISILYITSTNNQNYTVTVLIRGNNNRGEPRTAIYPLEQAQDLFEDVLARYVRTWKHRYPVQEFPMLAKYHEYTPGDYPMPRSFQRYEEWRKANITRYVDTSKLYSKKRTDECGDKYEYGYIDSGSDTIGIGGHCWIVESKSNRKVEIAGYDKKDTVKSGIYIGTGVTAVDLPDGDTVLLRANEATLLGEDANTLFSVMQMREHGVNVYDTAKRHGGLSCLHVEDYVIPLVMHESLLCLKLRKPTSKELRTLTPIEISADQVWNPVDLSDEDISESEYDELVAKLENEQDTVAHQYNKVVTTRDEEQDPSEYAKYLLHPGKEVVNKTLRNTTQYGTINMRLPMRTHFKSRNPILQRRRIMEPYATDTWFSTTPSYEGYNCAQIFYGINSHHVSHYGMASESDGPAALLDFFRQEGVPLSITRDNSRMQVSHLWQDYMRKYMVKDSFTEPYHPNQNPAERAMARQKEKLVRLMIDTGCEPEAWYRAACHVADVTNVTADETLDYRTPAEKRDGQTPDITGLLQYEFWQLVMIRDPTSSFPDKGGNEKLARWLGRAQDYGDKMCYWVLDLDTKRLLVRSMIRPATETDRPNQAISLEQADNENTTTNENFPLINFLQDFWDIEDENQVPKYLKNDLPGKPKIKEHQEIVQIDPEDLLNIYIHDEFTNKKGKTYQKERTSH